MTSRDDVEVDFSQSPRVVTVLEPATEYSMQDLVDTERLLEGSFRGMSEDKLLNASGKEDLGGGVVVGITVSHQNALVAFQARFTPAQIGTITTASGGPIGGTVRLIDASATFITKNVARGSYYINFTDMSVGDVVEVISETELRVTVPVNGSGNTLDISDDYHVYNITQVNATGGNLTAVDDVGSTIAPVLPTWGTQVVLTSSSSATLSESDDIQYASFNGGVWIDVLSSHSGTIFPCGTERAPVNNLVDAYAIATARGFMTIFAIGDLTIASGTFINFTFTGQGQNLSTLMIESAAVMTNCTFTECRAEGTLDGESNLRECTIGTLQYISGIVERCILDSSDITLGGSEGGHFIDCVSGVPGVLMPMINAGGSGQSFSLRGYSGGITIWNKTGPDPVSIDLNSGQVMLKNTVTNGTIVARGIGKLIDEAGNRILSGTWNGGVTIVNETIDSEIVNLVKYQDQKVYINTELVAIGEGTARDPYNTVADALDFAELVGITEMVILADATLDRNFKGFRVSSIGIAAVDIGGQDITGTVFYNLRLTGASGGGSFTGSACSLDNGMTGLVGGFIDCTITGVVTLAPGLFSVFVGDMSTSAIFFVPTIKMPAGAAHRSVVSGITGEITLSEFTHVDHNMHICLTGCCLFIDSSCTLGTIVVTGSGHVVDNSAGTTVNTSVLNTLPNTAKAVWESQVDDYAGVSGSFAEFIKKKLLTVSKFLGIK